MTTLTGISALEQRLLETYTSQGVVSAQGPSDMHFVLPGATIVQARYNHLRQLYAGGSERAAAYAAAIICEAAKIVSYGAIIYAIIILSTK